MSLRRYLAATLFVATGSAGCASDEGIASEDCSVQGKNQYVYELMRDRYLWADQSPNIDPLAYDSPEAVLEAMAYRSQDRWSGIQAAEQRARYFSEGRYLGVGVQFVSTRDDEVRIALTYHDSPAARAGIRRGMSVVSVNDQPLASILAEGSWATVDGPDEPGVEVKYELRDLDGSIRTIVLQKDWVQIQTVLEARTLDTQQGKVGYLLFTSFLGTAPDELRRAFGEFAAQGVTDLVIDLRYNGGGLLSSAAVLGSLILDGGQAGKPLTRLLYNARHAAEDGDLLLPEEQIGLGLERLFVLTGPGTASASELLVNGLRPFIPVHLVGGTTHGKPVGSYTFNYCDMAVVPITFRLVNSAGEGDYFEGLQPSCVIADDLEHALGDPDESRLTAALALMTGAPCPSEARRATPIRARAERLLDKGAPDQPSF